MNDIVELSVTPVNSNPFASSQSSSGEANGHMTPTADRILQIGTGFFASKTVLSATELGLFTELARSPMTANELQMRLGLHVRSIRDFLDALVALHLLDRRGDTYYNTPEADYYLDRNKPTYVGGILEMCSVRLYGHWGSLTEALRTGKPQGEAKAAGPDKLFNELYSSPEKLETFLKGMSGISLPTAKAIAQNSRGQTTAHSPMWVRLKEPFRFTWRWPNSTCKASGSTCRKCNPYLKGMLPSTVCPSGSDFKRVISSRNRCRGPTF